MTTPGTRGLTWESTRHQRRLQPASGADPAAGAGRAGSPQTCLSSLASSQPTGATPSCRSAGGAQRCPPRAPAAAADGLMPAGIAGARGGPGGGRGRAPFSGREHGGPRGRGGQQTPGGRGRHAGTGEPLLAPRPPRGRRRLRARGSSRPVPGCRPPPGSPCAVTNTQRRQRRPGRRVRQGLGIGGRPGHPGRAHGAIPAADSLSQPQVPEGRHLPRGTPQGAAGCPGGEQWRWVPPPPPSAHAGAPRRPHGRVRRAPHPALSAGPVRLRAGGGCRRLPLSARRGRAGPAPLPAPRRPPGPPRPDVSGPHWRPRRVYSGPAPGTDRPPPPERPGTCRTRARQARDAPALGHLPAHTVLLISVHAQYLYFYLLLQ